MKAAKRLGKVPYPKWSTDHGMRNVHSDEGKLTCVHFPSLSFNIVILKLTFRFSSRLHGSSLKEHCIFGFSSF